MNIKFRGFFEFQIRTILMNMNNYNSNMLVSMSLSAIDQARIINDSISETPFSIIVKRQILDLLIQDQRNLEPASFWNFANSYNDIK